MVMDTGLDQHGQADQVSIQLDRAAGITKSIPTDSIGGDGGDMDS